MTIQERLEYGAELKRKMNCCQAVAKAFGDTLEVPEATLMQISAGFGSGMGTMEGSCGALVGAVMVAGLRTGGNGTMMLSRKILPRFKELCGATICRELKGMGTGKILCSCEDCVRNAILAAEEALAEHT